jgi:hypothetical protein
MGQHSFTTVLNNIHTYVLNFVSGSSTNPAFNSFSSANIKHYFSGFITDIVTTMNARANILLLGAIIAVNKTLLIISPRVTISGGTNIFTAVLRQYIRIINNIQVLVSAPKFTKLQMRQRIKPKGTNIMIRGEIISATPLVKKYNHIYNVSGSTIEQIRNLTLDQLNYTII